MNKQVKQVIDELEPFNHGITIAIHQNKNALKINKDQRAGNTEKAT